MTRYRYIGELPLVLGTHSHGRNAEVFPAGDPIDEALLDGSTVVLNPGDEVETDDPIVASLIVEVVIDYGKLNKPALVALADQRGVASTGTAAELRSRLESLDAIAAGAGEADERGANSPDAVSSPGDASPTPQTGADSPDSNTEGA